MRGVIDRLVGMPAETSLAICSLIFGGVFERLPDLKVGDENDAYTYLYELTMCWFRWRLRIAAVRFRRRWAASSTAGAVDPICCGRPRSSPPHSTDLPLITSSSLHRFTSNHIVLTTPIVCSVDNSKNPRDYVGRFWLDSLVHDPKMLKNIVEVFGEDKIILGTDYPFPLGDVHPVRIYCQRRVD
jgi:aminocarboxymuconate-semialdehyde decarboxylase